MNKRYNRQKPMAFDTRRVVTRGEELSATIFNPQECSDFSWITGKVITLNGRKFRVRTVERTSTLPVCRGGEDINLIGSNLI